MYHPAAVADNSKVPLARSLENPGGKVAGFIDNAKPNFQFLIGDLETQLKARYGSYGIKAVKKHRKPRYQPDSSRAIHRKVV